MAERISTRRRFLQVTGASAAVALAGCLGGDDDGNADGGGMDAEPTDPAEAPRTTVDRFSEVAGMLMIRTDENDLPGPGELINLDRERFLTRGFEIAETNTLKNCPLVPEGSTASLRYGGGSTEPFDAWYDDQIVSYFTFEESSMQEHAGSIPLSAIYVSFNTNPGQEGGGVSSGFATEAASEQTHSVVATLPEQEMYSPLWMVNVYDNADFEAVSDIDSARDSELLREGVQSVNCPIVSVE